MTAAAELAAHLLPEEQGRVGAPQGERWLHWVHVIVFIASTVASASAWGASAAALCYHFAWSACFSWLLVWLAGAHDAAQRAGFLIDAADENVAALLRAARQHGPRAHARAPPPTATVYVTVFTESFERVLRPTIEQAARVVRRYNEVCMRAGAAPPGAAPLANLIILDDGLQLLPARERDARLRYYHSRGVAYVARARSGACGFVREGFFKKAGNLNHAHAVSRAAAADVARDAEVRAACAAAADAHASFQLRASTGPCRVPVETDSDAASALPAPAPGDLPIPSNGRRALEPTCARASLERPSSQRRAPDVPAIVSASPFSSSAPASGETAPVAPTDSAGAFCCPLASPWCSLRACALRERPRGGARAWDEPPTREQLGAARVHGDVRLGEILLLLDNDSFAPDDALVDSVALLAAESRAGFVQHVSAPLADGVCLATSLHAVSSLVFWGVTMRARAWAAPAPLLGHNVALRRSALEQAGGYHTGRGADDLSTGVAMRLRAGSYGVLAKLYPWHAGFREGLPRSYRQLARQWRRYGAVANGTVSQPLPDWRRKGALQSDMAALLLLPGAEDARGAACDCATHALELGPDARAHLGGPPPAYAAAVARRGARAARVPAAECLDLLQFWLPGVQGLCFFGIFLPAVLFALLRGCAGPEGGGFGIRARWDAPGFAMAGTAGEAWALDGALQSGAWAVADASRSGIALGISASAGGGGGGAGGAHGTSRERSDAVATARAPPATRWWSEVSWKRTPHLGLPIGLAVSLLLPAAASAVLRAQRDAPAVRARAHVAHALLGAPLHVSLWFAFTLGFCIDHALKRVSAYAHTNTHAEAALGARAHMRAHCAQIGYGLACCACSGAALARAPARLAPAAVAALVVGLNLAGAPFLLDPPALLTRAPADVVRVALAALARARATCSACAARAHERRASLLQTLGVRRDRTAPCARPAAAAELECAITSGVGTRTQAPELEGRGVGGVSRAARLAAEPAASKAGRRLACAGVGTRTQALEASETSEASEASELSDAPSDSDGARDSDLSLIHI